MYYLAFDTETTGLADDSNLLTACFVLLDSNLYTLKTLNLKIKYNKYIIYPKALEVNGINILEHHNDKDSVDISTARVQLEEMICDYKDIILIGHNVDFDIKMCKLNNLFDTDIENYFSHKTMDTLKICKILKQQGKIPKGQSLSLKKIVDYFGLNVDNFENYHNAEYDTLMTIKLLKHIIFL